MELATITNQILVAAVFFAAYLLVRTAYVGLLTPRLISPGLVSRSPVDILVPVRNEVLRGLETNLMALVNQTHPTARLIITDDRSTDGSTEVIRQLCHLHPERVYSIDGVETLPGWMGKTFALAQAKLLSNAEWMALVDSDIVAERELVTSVLAYAENQQLDAVSVLPAFEYRSFWVGVVLPSMVWLSAMRVSPTQTNRQSSKLAFGLGNFILVRRSAHDAIGGFDAYKSSVLDDCEVMERLKNAGYRVAVIDGATLLSSPMYVDLRELCLGFTKNSFAAMKYSWLKVIGFLFLEGVLLIYLPLALIQGVELASVSAVFLTGTMVIAGLRLKAPFRYYVLFPIGHMISVGIIAYSAILTGLGPGISWKGRIVK